MENMEKYKSILEKYQINSPEMLEDIIQLAFLASNIYDCFKDFEEFCDLMSENKTELKS